VPPHSLKGELSGGVDYGTRFHRAMQLGKPFDDKTRLCMEIIGEFTRGMNVMKELVVLDSTMQDGEKILVQGVIDLLAISKDNAVLIDYKTTNASEEKLVALYKPQLDAYRKIVERALNRPIKTYIYSTTHAKLIDIEK
jgi:ATP-dependent exoDNAse (exonuclease V) beta subunit